MIVMDLEWNHGTVDKQLLLEGRTLRFEIIQIGAVQVDSLGNICKTFERLVMPCVHPVSYTHLDVYKRQFILLLMMEAKASMVLERTLE